MFFALADQPAAPLTFPHACEVSPTASPSHTVKGLQGVEKSSTINTSVSLNSPLTPPKDTSNQVMFSRLHVWVDVFRSGTGKSAPMGLNTNSSLRFRETAMEQASDGMSFLFFWSLKDGDKQLEPAGNFIGRSHPTYTNLISRYLTMWPKTPKTWALSLQTNRAGPTQI